MDFEEIIARWRDALTTRDEERTDPDIGRHLREMDRECARLLGEMRRGPERTCVWADLPDPGDIYLRDQTCHDTCVHIGRMALCYAAEGCALWKDQGLLRGIEDALSFVLDHWYNENIRLGGEWWFKEIGIPLRLNQAAALLGGDMDEDLRERCFRAVYSFTSDPKRMCLDAGGELSTGANRVWKCLALAELGALTRDEEKLRTAREDIRDVFHFTCSGDGFYRDGSFVQHQKFPYNGGYGLSLLETLVQYMELLAGTPWAIDGGELEMLLRWVRDAYMPFIWRGACMDMVRGREVSRAFSEGHVIGHRVVECILRLADSLPEGEAKPLLGWAKGQILSDRYRDFYLDASLRGTALGKALARNSAVEPGEDAPFCRVYSGMARALSRRADYAVGVSMCSRRIGRYESIHDENVRGWYSADGMTSLYTPDQGQFSDGFYPTVNAYRLPGTTVDTGRRPEKGNLYGKEPPVTTDWAGGAQLLSRYASVGMELRAELGDLRARKSWFLFDREIVCLGAGICATTGRPIETIVENRKLAPGQEDALSVDGMPWGGAPRELLSGPGFLHLRGMGPKGDVGYYFPAGGMVELNRAERTGEWSEINRQTGRPGRIRRRYLEIVLSHGVDPQNASYAYVLLPGLDALSLARYAGAPEVEILENRPQVQAVRQKALGLTGMNCWEGEGASAGEMTCLGRASVMARLWEGELSLSVCDPTMAEEMETVLEWAAPAREVVRLDEEIEVLSLGPALRLRVRARGAMGRSFTAQFRMR